jgi:hypothetical protein
MKKKIAEPVTRTDAAWGSQGAAISHPCLTPSQHRFISRSRRANARRRNTIIKPDEGPSRLLQPVAARTA